MGSTGMSILMNALFASRKSGAEAYGRKIIPFYHQSNTTDIKVFLTALWTAADCTYVHYLTTWHSFIFHSKVCCVCGSSYTTTRQPSARDCTSL